MSQTPSSSAIGTVYIVGSGPGDIDLLTLRAARLIGQADAVVYDHLIAEGVLDLARADAEKIYVGKKSSNHTVPQADLNRLLVQLARAGKSVVRLKGGDPFVFGRGGEEIEALVQSRIPFEVVPGVTAAAGCAAYAGIPLTHRDHAQAVAFATGHLKDGTINLDWPALARPRLTIVFYMGVGGIGEICRQLIAHGLPEGHPAAVVQNGTTRRQRVLTADLATLAEKVEAAQITSPALIIVGTVVRLQPTLAWFQPQP
ncbi:MAG: uroporphyrinogen-III C-methyltransferase [Candidatus Accumulibacter sp.]|uniref:uroporphyrinogen-III C-methyltransferase n=1 Tax=Accumulibacter sp. TaxID=2053492 RepID=UPI0025E035E9|nr:uroporphyrinogen-III C-methyltransferase [Accumulibacter sp.]MCP5249899.1 uroporphyrinogen-III C-methyltransferase [Accumulibacter sp.]